MAAKKTLEEIRASTRERQKRWREKYAWKHRERVKEVYGRSNAQKSSEEGVTPKELERYEKRKVQETYYAPGEWEGAIASEQEGGHEGVEVEM